MLWFPEFAAIANTKYNTEWVLLEEEPLEDMLRRFDPGGRMSAMSTPSRVVKLGISQERQFPRMRSQAQDVEGVIKISAEEKKKAEPITEDKKAE